jgi:aldehyde dehydrogenase
VKGGYYIEPTIFKGKNNMRVFQEEIFGPVVSVTTFKTVEEAIAIANDTSFGLGAGVFTRDAHELVRNVLVFCAEIFSNLWFLILSD